MRRVLVMALAAGLVFTTGAVAHQPADPVSAYAAVLADPVRTDADRERDVARHTAETLAFAEVKPGQKIADMIIGGGYFTRAFSAAVGPEGHVTAWQPDEFMAFQASYGEAVTAADALPNVDGVHSPIGAPAFPAGLDLIFTAQNYHDLHLAPFAADTATKVNAAAFAALKPGGLYVIIDHYAVDGSGISAADSLHRIDIGAVRSEVEAAGFVLDGSAICWPTPPIRARRWSSIRRSGATPASSCCGSGSPPKATLASRRSEG